jgi:hypothetical protein
MRLSLPWNCIRPASFASSLSLAMCRYAARIKQRMLNPRNTPQIRTHTVIESVKVKTMAFQRLAVIPLQRADPLVTQPFVGF